MVKSFLFSLILTGTIIGAGFATGQELYSFFVIPSAYGLVLFVFSVILIILMSFVIGTYVGKHNFNNISVFFEGLFSSAMSKINFFIITMFLFICYCITISGTGVLFKNYFNTSYFFGVMVISLISVCIIQFDINGLKILNLLLTPVIIVLLFILSLCYIYQKKDVNVMNILSVARPIKFSLIYFGYNFLNIMPIIIKERKNYSCKTFKNALLITMVFLLITGILMIICMYHKSILKYDSDLIFPDLIISVMPDVKKMYVTVVYFSMLTTASACLFSFVSNISDIISINKKIIIFLTAVIGIFVSELGFTTLLRNGYYFFGVIGFFVILMSVVKIIKN